MKQVKVPNKKVRPTKVEVTCPACKRSVTLERCIRQRPVTVGVTEVGIECPACKHWTHSFYETAPIKEARAELKKAPAGAPGEAAAKAKFEAIYKSEQERVAGLVKGGENQSH